MASTNPALSNWILASLPTAEYQRLSEYLEPVELSLGQVLYEAGQPITYIYFPIQALISLTQLLPTKEQPEVALVGNEGLVGLPALLGGQSTPGRATVQIADSAMRIDAQTLKAEFDRGGLGQKQVQLYIQWSLTEMAQNVSCQSNHQLRPRLARWLLSIQDRLQTDRIVLTQKCLASLLGARRATVSEAASYFQQENMIRYQRGHIEILDRAALEQSACECYGLLQKEHSRLHKIAVGSQED